MHSAGHFSMLGLGDIVMPGLLLCFVLRYDNWKRQTAEPALPPPMLSHGSLAQKVTYFHCSLIGYFVGEYSSVARHWPLGGGEEGLKEGNKRTFRSERTVG